MKYSLCLLFFSCFLSAVICAQSPFKMVSEQKVDATRIVVDELGNVYLLSNTGIERRNAVGNGVFRTSDMQWGEFHDVDVTDPLRPFVHFPAAGKVVFFDNTLSLQGSPIDLYARGYDNTEFMCGSRGDGFWLWDARNSEIMRVDRNFNKLYSTGNLSILFKSPMQPLALMERGQFLYLLNRDYRLFVFDMFGAWKRTVQLDGPSTCQLDAERVIVFYETGSMQFIDTAGWIKQDIPLPGSVGAFFFRGSKLYWLNDAILRTFQFVENARN